MKKLLIILLLTFPIGLMADGIKGEWFNVHSHKTVKHQSKRSISKSKKHKKYVTPKSIRKLQRKWHTFKH